MEKQSESVMMTLPDMKSLIKTGVRLFEQKNCRNRINMFLLNHPKKLLKERVAFQISFEKTEFMFKI